MTYSKELNERSPLRIFERSIHGGLGRGNLGVVCSSPGVGKTAFLVGIALDYVMRERQVLHVGLDQPVERIRNYYDEIFSEMARSEELEDVGEVRLKIERHRRIHTYVEHTFTVENLRKTLAFLRSHTELDPDLMIVDGFSWDEATAGDLEALRTIAGEQEAELWLSARTPRGGASTHPKGYPDSVARFEGLINVMVQLRTTDGTVHLRLLKDHDNPEPGTITLDLDPTTLLLVKR
jgi:hypothetical protein